ncbi:MAG: protein translocase subunit SecF [bacterium]
MDILGKRKIWYFISITLIVLSVLFLLLNSLNFGIDFMGGSIIQFSFDEEVSSNQVREVLEEIQIAENAQIQQFEEDDIPHGIVIRSQDLDPEQTEEMQQIEEAMADSFSGAELLSSDSVGASIGSELKSNAIWALVIASISMVIYISIRFEFRFAIIAIIALLHDVLITMGVFAMLGLEVNTPFVAALLMILGYSINDTIVIFDRIRENMNLMHKTSFMELANKAVVDTLPRSLNTSITTLITVLAIYIYGGVEIRTFMLALLVGILAGTYSSIFLASPLLVSWSNKFAEE